MTVDLCTRMQIVCIQDQEMSDAIDRAIASSGREQWRGTGKNWKEAARGWNGEGEIMTGIDVGEVEQARSSESAKKRRFDSLGGGLIPLKRRQNAEKRTFDSLGGGLIPPRERQLPPHHRSKVDRESAKKNYLEKLSIVAKARRRFDSLGGGVIPPRKRQLPPQPPHHKSSFVKKAAYKN